MSMQMAVFTLGSLLMLVAILGGGFEVKELKVPKVGRNSRLAACACGMLFIFVGIYLDRPAAAAAPAAAAPQKEKGADVAAAPVPQIVLISGLASQAALRTQEIAKGPDLSTLPVAPRPLSANAAESQESQKAAEPATAQQVGDGKAKSQQSGQAAASASSASKDVPWEQRPRQWINRLKGKGATG